MVWIGAWSQNLTSKQVRTTAVGHVWRQRCGDEQVDRRQVGGEHRKGGQSVVGAVGPSTGARVRWGKYRSRCGRRRWLPVRGMWIALSRLGAMRRTINKRMGPGRVLTGHKLVWQVDTRQPVNRIESDSP